jgi:hypothetical protein
MSCLGEGPNEWTVEPLHNIHSFDASPSEWFQRKFLSIKDSIRQSFKRGRFPSVLYFAITTN